MNLIHRKFTDKIEIVCYNKAVNKNKEVSPMKKYICNVCGYVYDPEVGDPDSGIAPGTAWEDVPAEWVCPLCGVGKEDFSEEA